MYTNRQWMLCNMEPSYKSHRLYPVLIPDSIADKLLYKYNNLLGFKIAFSNYQLGEQGPLIFMNTKEAAYLLSKWDFKKISVASNYLVTNFLNLGSKPSEVKATKIP